MSVITTSTGSKVLSKYNMKTESRIIAENSILGAVGHLMCIVSTHFIVGNNNNSIVPVPPVKQATKGARLLEKLISEANDNTPVYPVHPGLIFSTDEQTSFVFKGKSKKKMEWVIASEAGTTKERSYYGNKMGRTDHLNRMRVQMNHTFNGLGATGPIYLTVNNLNNRELPESTCPSGLLVIKVPGLCLGSQKDIRYNQVGYLVFIRNTKDPISKKSAETKNFEYYNNEVLLPFVCNCLIKYFGFNPETDQLTKDLTAVTSSDGCNAQLNAVTTEENLKKEEALKIRRNKVGAASTGTQQACDLAEVFSLINNAILKMTCEKIGEIV